MWRVLGTGDVHTGFWMGELREGGYLEDQGVDRRIILKRIFKKSLAEIWTALL